MWVEIAPGGGSSTASIGVSKVEPAPVPSCIAIGTTKPVVSPVPSFTDIVSVSVSVPSFELTETTADQSAPSVKLMFSEPLDTGDFVGLADDSYDSNTDGMSEGSMVVVGSNDGNRDFVGSSDGIIDGMSDGIIDGISDGIRVCVGSCDGIREFVGS